VSIGLALLSASIAYLLGSISFARLVTQWWTSGKDITKHKISVDGTDESYKILSVGANSVSSLLGIKAGVLVSVFDILKVFLPALFFKYYFPEQPAYHLIAATFGMVGHVWPIYYRFHGGAGFTAIMGILPIAGMLLGMLVIRNMIVASLGWLWLLIPWLWWRTDGDIAHILFAVAVNIIFILAMIPEYQTAMKFKKEGKYLEYGLGNLKSNPMGRGMLKIAEFFHVEVK
jgi:glycerol-3-phosphate acyltransferase PlsY